MIKLEDSEESFYFCTSANWQCVVKAEDLESAAQKALSLSIAELNDGDGAMLSPCLRIKKIHEDVENEDEFIRIDHVLADIGMHKESKAMFEILKELEK